MEFVIKKFNIDKQTVEAKRRFIMTSFCVSRDDLNEINGDDMKSFKEFLESKYVKEAVIAGDSGDDPKKIASGEKSGAITNISAGLKKKKEDKDAESK